MRPYQTSLLRQIDPKYAGYVDQGIKSDGYKLFDLSKDYAGNIAAVCLASQLYHSQSYAPSNTGIPGHLVSSFINDSIYVSLQQIYASTNLTAESFSRHLVQALSTIIGTVYYFSYCNPATREVLLALNVDSLDVIRLGELAITEFMSNIHPVRLVADTGEFTFEALEDFTTRLRDMSNNFRENQEVDKDELDWDAEEFVDAQDQQFVDLPTEEISPSSFHEEISPSPFFQQPQQVVYIPPGDQPMPWAHEATEVDTRKMGDYFGDFDLADYQSRQQDDWSSEEEEKKKKLFISHVTLPRPLLAPPVKLELKSEFKDEEKPVLIKPIQIYQLNQGAVGAGISQTVRELSRQVNILDTPNLRMNTMG